MSIEPIARLRFALLSLGFGLLKFILFFFCVGMIMGWSQFFASKPGASRGHLFFATLILCLVFAALQCNLAWRRARDAKLPKWLLATYIILTVGLALLEPFDILAADFSSGNSGMEGLWLLRIVALVGWFWLCFASPKPDDFDADAFIAQQTDGLRARRGNEAGPAPALPLVSRSSSYNPPAPSSGGARRPQGFGRRGLA
jgi:uncharacterized membrane protein YhaH (DUF805 family)